MRNRFEYTYDPSDVAPKGEYLNKFLAPQNYAKFFEPNMIDPWLKFSLQKIIENLKVGL